VLAKHVEACPQEYMHEGCLRLHKAGSLVHFVHDDGNNESNNIQSGGDPTINSILFIEIFNVIVSMTLQRPDSLVYRKILDQCWRLHKEEYSK